MDDSSRTRQSGFSDEIVRENHLPPDLISEFQVFDSESSNSEEQPATGSPANPRPRLNRMHSRSDEMGFGEDRSGSQEAPRSARGNTSHQHLLVSNPNLPDLDPAAKGMRRSLGATEDFPATSSQDCKYQLVWPDSPRNRLTLSVAQP